MKIQKPQDAQVNKQPSVSGADVAPTKKAEERERERHAIERKMGRSPGGHDGQLRDHRSPEVTRQKLDKAAEEADKRVAGHPLPKKTH